MNNPSLLTHPLAWAGRLAGSRIRWKIIAPYLVLTLIVAVAGTFIATRLVTGSLQDRFDNQLAEASRVTSDSVVRRERQHLALVRSVAFTIGVPEATQAKDPSTLRLLVEPLAANSKGEYVEVLGADGKRILGLHLTDASRLTYVPITDKPDRNDLSMVTNVLARRQDDQGDKFAQIVGLPEGPALYTAGPIYNGDTLVGVVLVGSSLESLLPAIKHEALADVTIYDFNGGVLASTLEHSPDETPILQPDVSTTSDAIVGEREVKTLFGRNFDFLFSELRIRNETVGLVSIALPSSFISHAGSSTRWELTVVFAIATLIVLAVGWLIARGVTAPLLRLVSTARAVTAGDLTARTHVQGGDEVGTLAASFDVMTERLAQQHLQTIRALTSAIDARDPYTAGHSIRVGQLSVEIGRTLELPKRDLQFLEIGGYLHDVGKIGIRDSVLLKEGRLTEQERALIEDHPRIGLQIVQHVDLAKEVLEVIGGHHEKLDGTGYPQGLEGQQLTMFARVSAVSDIYDALTTERPYKPALSVERAVAYLKTEGDAAHLDPRVVQALIDSLTTWLRRLETDASLKGLSLPEQMELERTSA